MKSNKQRALDLISAMTLDEKLAQIGSYWMFDLQTNGTLDWEKASGLLKNGIGQITRVAGASTLDPVNAARAGNSLQKFLVEKTRLGIPAILHEECCAGMMGLGGTVYPQMLGLASTFQPELAEKLMTAVRQQMLAIGARQGLAPVLDLARDPRWGRIEETFGEDPTLVSHFGMAYIKGLQGENLAEGVAATGKHFIGHSMSQGGLNCAPVHMGMNEIFNYFLPPFHVAIRDAKLASMMNAYPELDGEVVAASQRILTDLLRNKLGFTGPVVSDYESVIMLHNFHKVAEDLPAAAQMALNAGIDVELPTVVCYSDSIKAALEKGDLSIETIDQAVFRHLQLKFDLGLFENPYADEGKVLEVYETDGQRQLARELARKSIVLLKNDGVLPLPKDVKSLAVIGPNADCGRNQLADYSYTAMRQMMELKQPANSAFVKVNIDSLAPHEVKITTVLEGIQSAVEEGTRIVTAKGCDYLSQDTSGIGEAVKTANQADAVVLVLGDRSGLTPECTTGETRDCAELNLPGVQEDLFRAIQATGKPLVVVLMTGRPYAIKEIATSANAILEAWLPGEEGGPAIADVIFGDENPGGRLPVTFPRSAGQLPITYNSKPSGTRSHWYVDYVNEETKPLFPFGHGLSYTTFEYADLRLSRNQATTGETVDVTVTVKNTGARFGSEVVQLYTADEYASTPRPVKELKGYGKVSLQTGESKKITFHLPINQLAFYDNDLNLVLESGAIKILVGSSSEDIRLTGEIEITGAKKMPIEEPVFVCPVTLK